MEKRRLIKTCKNGTKVWGVVERCEKCNGTGRIPEYFHIANGTCFDCNGSGTIEVKEYEYTAEHLAKLEAKRAKKAADREAKLAAEIAERESEAERRRIEEEKLLAEIERKRRGHYFGEIGQKIEIEVEYKGCGSYDTYYGTTYIFKFDTDDGAHLVWKTGTKLGGNEWFIEEGDKITIKASIKDHKEYHGIEQTELQRVKIVKAVTKMRELTRAEHIEAEANRSRMTDEEYEHWLKGVWMSEPKV